MYESTSFSCPPSSPIRKGCVPPESCTAQNNYVQIRQQGIVQDLPSEVFLQAYLHGHSYDTTQWSPEESSFVSRITLANESLYTHDAPLLRLLNSISRRIFESHANDGYALVFRSAENRSLTNPFTGNVYTPDIVVFWERQPNPEFPEIDYARHDQVPQTWCAFSAVGEVKTGGHGKYQLGVYLQNLLQLHPELNAVLGLTVNTGNYSLFYHDADVIHRSAFTFEQPGPLYAFVRKLYTRPFQDTSMLLIEPQSQRLAWATKIGDHVYVSEAPRSVAGPGQRRYTTPAIEVETSARVFIKDIWRDPQRLFQEFELFKRAHEEQDLAGLMLVYAHGHVLNESKERVATAAHQFGLDQGRQKMRLVTKDIGRPLETVQSLRQFLSVMYDACVVQRNLYRKCGILHRDISDRNIMLAPVEGDYCCRGGYAKVKFLNQVLQADDKESSPEPTCLVIDLGNGSDLNVPRVGDELRQRTGTPKFIARSVSSGKLLNRQDYSTTGVNLPSPDGISEYVHRMHTTEYQHEFPNAPTGTDPKFAHQLFHDAESTFWVIAWTLVRSASQGYRGERNQAQRFRWFYHIMCRHYPVPDEDDARQVCQVSEDYWTSILHPDLQSMGPMLSRMFVYVKPEWAFSPFDPEHVHEALMRLLLAEIVKLNDKDISLVVGARSIPPPPENMPGLPCSLGSISGSGSVTPANQVPGHQNNRSPAPQQPASGPVIVAGHNVVPARLRELTRSFQWHLGAGELQKPN